MPTIEIEDYQEATRIVVQRQSKKANWKVAQVSLMVIGSTGVPTSALSMAITGCIYKCVIFSNTDMNGNMGKVKKALKKGKSCADTCAVPALEDKEIFLVNNASKTLKPGGDPFRPKGLRIGSAPAPMLGCMMNCGLDAGVLDEDGMGKGDKCGDECGLPTLPGGIEDMLPAGIKVADILTPPPGAFARCVRSLRGPRSLLGPLALWP